MMSLKINQYTISLHSNVQFKDSEDAKKALEQLNGFELAGRPMKVGHVTERTAEMQGNAMLDSDEMDRAGIDLGATGRLQLMAKLAEGIYTVKPHLFCQTRFISIFTLISGHMFGNQ